MDESLFNMTILYNIDTKTTISRYFEKGYYIDGKKPNLPINIVELEVVNVIPELNENEYLIDKGFTVDLENKRYVKVWEVKVKTPEELRLEEWGEVNYSLRIVAPKQLVFQYPAIEIWFRLNGLPIRTDGDNILLYCNEIMPEHQALVDALEGVITIEEL